MHIENQIALRPRFKLELPKTKQEIIEALKNDFTNTDFTIKFIDNHIFIGFKKEKQHFWSPHLHLEIVEQNKSHSYIKGLFGPPPSVWTMFMFLNFIVAGMFLVFAIWAYSNYSLNQNYKTQVFSMVFMSILWVILYIAGSIGKTKGKPQIKQLCTFFTQTLKLENAKLL